MASAETPCGAAASSQPGADADARVGADAAATDVPSPEAGLAARAARAGLELDVVELVAVLRDATDGCHAGVAHSALQALGERCFADDRNGPICRQRAAALETADGAAVVLKAFLAFHATVADDDERRSKICWLCSHVLFLQHWIYRQRGAKDVAATAALVLLAKPPAGTSVQSKLIFRRALGTLLYTLSGPAASLPAEALAAGAAEHTMDVFDGLLHDTAYAHVYVVALLALSKSADQAVFEQLVAAGGIDAVLSALAKGDAITLTSVMNMLWSLLPFAEKAPPATEEMIQRRHDAMHTVTAAALAGPARSSGSVMLHTCNVMSYLVLRSGPAVVGVVVEAIVATLRALLETPTRTRLAVNVAGIMATVLLECFGRCGGADTASPGTHALGAGALPAMEAVITAAAAADEEVLRPHWDRVERVVAELRQLSGLETLKARATLASQRLDVAEMVAVVRDATAARDACIAGSMLHSLVKCCKDDPRAHIADVCAASLKVTDCTAVALEALHVFLQTPAANETHAGGALDLSAIMLCFLHGTLKHRGALDATVAATRLLIASLAEDASTQSQFYQRRALARLLVTCIRDYECLRAEAIAAGAAERILEGVTQDARESELYLYALVALCGPLEGNRSEAAERLAAADGINVLVAAMMTSSASFFGVSLLCHLLPFAHKEPPVSDDMVRSRDAALCTVATDALAGRARLSGDFMMSTCRVVLRVVQRGDPMIVTAVVDSVVAALRAMVAAPPADTSSAFQVSGAAAAVFLASMGRCGGADTASPGTYVLRAGALQLMEATLAAADESVNESTHPNWRYVGRLAAALRQLGARADAVAAELLAEEEAEAAARKTKAASKGAKSKSSKRKGAAAKPAAAKPAAAASAAEAVETASAATAPEPPQLPPPPPPPAPAPDAAPPPLPPWLLQAMQAMPTPSQPEPPPAAPPSAAASLARTAADEHAELPRELECAICLDAAVQGRTPCCAQAAFCAPCAAALTDECPLCRAPWRAAGAGGAR